MLAQKIAPERTGVHALGTKVRGAAVAFLLALSLLPGAAHGAEKISNSSCLECHEDKTLTKTGANGKEIPLFVDAATFQKSVHAKQACADCHSDLTSKHPDDEVAAKPVDCAQCHKDQSKSFGASVHGVAIASGSMAAANCVDCHGKHNIAAPSSPESPLHYSRLAQTCGECHEKEAQDVTESVHGKALAAGHREAPTCTDCHSEHKIVALSGSNALKLSAEVCSNCHASERLNTKFRMPSNRVKTFFESYHGLAAQYGSTVTANCGSCHGVHKVLPSSDPNSTIHPKNRVATCGKCHPGATDKFARSKVHVDAELGSASDGIGQKINRWVRLIYLWLIPTTVGLMAAHNILIFGRKLLKRFRAADLSITRMSRAQRMQHMILASSFIVLAITGFALRFPDSWLARLMSEGFRSWTHRIAGVVLLVVGAYHLLYLASRKEGRKLARDLFPGIQDLRDLIQNGKYLTGLSPTKPKIGRFGYAEKMEYWAVVWGTLIMGASGLAIWFKMDVTHFLPRWAVEVALTIHYYEAILACLAILVWHFYHAIFDPDVYPLNWAAWNGKVSRHWQEEEHPGETLEEKPAQAEPPRGEAGPRDSGSEPEA